MSALEPADVDASNDEDAEEHFEASPVMISSGTQTSFTSAQAFRSDENGSNDDDGEERNQQPEPDTNILVVGGSQSLGPGWTQDDSIEPPEGLQDMGGWVAAVYTPEQQARLGVDANGAEIPDDADPTEETTADLSTNEQQVGEAFQAAGFPGVLPVIVDPEPAQDEAEDADGPCHSLPETSMVIAQWNPQCDENSQYVPLQCDRDGDCWCV